MDDAARARTAARAAVEAVSPSQLRDLIDVHLQNAAATPGALTRLSARATTPEVDADRIDRRAAGVQLIYEGLKITRRLARDPPWTVDDESVEADLTVLAADVLVAKGFSLLARTEVAPMAVETVQAFGRAETIRASDPSRSVPDDRSLEADVFEMAIVAGMTAAGIDPPPNARSFAVELAGAIEDEPSTEPALLSEPAIDALAALAGHGGSSTVPDRIWAGSSTER